MKRLVSRIRRSLFARLLLIFVATAFAFAALDEIAERAGDRERPLKRLLGQHLNHYVEYLTSDIGWPPDTERARHLTERIPVDIRIAGPAGEWLRCLVGVADFRGIDADQA